jgi:hypothetical protein
MRFTAEHRFHGSPAAVAAILTDPEFYVTLVLPDLSQPTVLDHRSDDQSATLGLRYEFVGSLDPIARRLLGSKRLAWIQEVQLKRPEESGQLSFRAESDPKRLHGSADFTMVAEGDETIRRLTGELIVAVPIIGSRAERQIVPGLLRRLDIEAEGVNKALAG